MHFIFRPPYLYPNSHLGHHVQFSQCFYQENYFLPKIYILLRHLGRYLLVNFELQIISFIILFIWVIIFFKVIIINRFSRLHILINEACKVTSNTMFFFLNHSKLKNMLCY